MGETGTCRIFAGLIRIRFTIPVMVVVFFTKLTV
jgi:hypothetical protein